MSLPRLRDPQYVCQPANITNHKTLIYQKFLDPARRATASLHSRMRQHPGQMDEESVTTVPGELVLVESEGLWGRHLPMDDDMLDLPLFMRHSAQI